MAAPPLAWTEHGSGPPLLLIHGVMITGEMFAPVLERLAARHRVIGPDLRGHGRAGICRRRTARRSWRRI